LLRAIFRRGRRGQRLRGRDGRDPRASVVHSHHVLVQVHDSVATLKPSPLLLPLLPLLPLLVMILMVLAGASDLLGQLAPPYASKASPKVRAPHPLRPEGWAERGAQGGLNL